MSVPTHTIEWKQLILQAFLREISMKIIVILREQLAGRQAFQSQAILMVFSVMEIVQLFWIGMQIPMLIMLLTNGCSIHPPLMMLERTLLLGQRILIVRI